MLTRHVDARDDADVHRVGDAAAPDRHRILDHVERMLARRVVIARRARAPRMAPPAVRDSPSALSSWSVAGVDRGDAASSFADAQFRPRRQDELRIDQQVALVHVAVGIGPELDLPLGAGVVDLRLVISA